MAGHSKWANIQHRKGRQDEKRGKVFTKVAKELIIAAKNGADPVGNSRLRAAIAAAKAVNLPKDKMEAAIRKGSGADGSAELFEITYEGYAPGGVAVIVETATDNKNRTVADVRHIFTKNGGTLGESNSVAWMFERKGLINLPKAKYSEDQAMELALEAGADDIHDEDDFWTIHTAFADFNTVRDALEEKSVEMESAELAYVAANNLEISDQEVAEKIMKLIDMLEDYDDVQNVHANFDLSDDLAAKLS